MAVNEDLYSWMLKTQGMPAVEWYRNNPSKPSESNPHLPKGTYVPKASADDPQKGQFASTVDPYKSKTLIASGPSPKAQPFDDYLNSLYEKASAQYEEQKKGYPSLPSEVASASRGSDIFYYPNYGEYGGYVSKVNPDKEQVARVQGYISQGLDKDPKSPLYGQNLSNLLRTTGGGGWHVGAASASDPEPLQYGLENVGLESYRAPRKASAISSILENIYSKESGGKSLDDLLKEGGGSDDSLIAAEYGAGFPKQPAWMKQIEAEYNKVKDKPYSPGTPKPGRGMGDTWEGPVREASGPSDTNYSVATALSGSDEQRQQQTFQAEYDPQKAQTASAAAKAYKKAASTEDPFRSQAAFG